MAKLCTAVAIASFLSASAVAQTAPTEFESVEARLEVQSLINKSRQFLLVFEQQRCSQILSDLVLAFRKQAAFATRYQDYFARVGAANTTRRELENFSGQSRLLSAISYTTTAITYKCSGESEKDIDVYNTLAGFSLDIALLYLDKVSR